MVVIIWSRGKDNQPMTTVLYLVSVCH